MKPIQFKEQTNVLAEDQPEYLALPVHVYEESLFTSCWELDEDDLDNIKRTGRIWVQILTFGQPLQPQCIFTTEPEVFNAKSNN